MARLSLRTWLLIGLHLGLLWFPGASERVALGQLAPEIGYMHPAGGAAGSSVEVILGGFDWTPDMQLFVHNPRIQLELLGPPGPVLVPEPPYWFGAKARGYAWPLSREFRARLTLPADLPPGLVKWQVANANGASPVAQLHVGQGAEILEDPERSTPQVLPPLPVTVSGQIRRIEEIDRYQFQVDRNGPVTIEVVARRIASPLHSMIQVRDPLGKVVVDSADTEGRDQTVSFIAQANTPYTLALHDLDFAGDRSYVYRLMLSAAPQILAAYPSAGRRGETRPVEFVGLGLATGTAQLESVTQNVTFPADGSSASLTPTVTTPFGAAMGIPLVLSDLPESVEPSGATNSPLPAPPCAVTGTFETPLGTDQYPWNARKGETWRVVAQSRSPARRLDLDLAILGPDGKELARVDDSPGTTDAELLFTVPADGTYQILLTDRSGKSGTRESSYRLSVEQSPEEFTVTIPPLGAIPLGGTFKLPVKLTRSGGFAGPVVLALNGIPEGVVAPADLTIAADKTDITLDLTCAADAPVTARLCQITASTTLRGQPVTRPVGATLLAVVMKPRIKLTPEGLDDVRKVHRGSTFLAPVLIERLEGYQGEIVLEMTAKQQRHRQGLASDEFTVPPAAQRIEYPIFVPEWMETTKTSRMILNGAVKVPDPRGTVRTLLQKQELRIGVLPEGALIKLAHSAGEPQIAPGGELQIPVALSRAPEFREPVKVELVGELVPTRGDPRPAPHFAADALSMSPDQPTAMLKIRVAQVADLAGEHTLRLRATALQEGKWKVMSETDLLVIVSKK